MCCVDQLNPPSKERIQQAAEDWAADRFPAVTGEHERIPLPERKWSSS
jgi:hypothetical protein